MLERIQTLLQQAARARRDGHSLESQQRFAEAVVLSRQGDASHELIQALKGLGQLERDMGHGERAQPLYEEAVSLCRLQNDPLQLAHTVRHLGDIHQDAGHLDDAELCYREALDIYRVHSGTKSLDLANAVRPLAILEERLGRKNAAIALWTEARGLYDEVNVQDGVNESAARLRRLGAL